MEHRYRKHQLLGLLDTLTEINDTLVALIELGEDGADAEEIANILSECQQIAINIGNDVEDRGIAGKNIMHLLEDYCEQVYQISKNFADRKVAKKLTSDVQMKLRQIKSLVSGKLKEVIFLPYKASMWDSLESIYLTADADPECDAFVVAIPYFDRNPDGSFGQMHYEGAEYPFDIPITDYREYDIALAHPDMIYIHNPYDECNIVTSVHPDYYAKRLKDLTDILVYVPYFMLAEINPNNPRAVDKIKHFILVPGVFYAHKVIVQSLAMREIYINVLEEFCRDNKISVSRSQLGMKISGAGSPKFDALKRRAKEGWENLPSDWQTLIFRVDGIRKKIVMYNNGLSAFLEHRGAMLDKIEDVLQTFHRYRDDVLLWWRPHPLYVATIQSCVPALLSRYQNIVEKYRTEGWGIYDDTGDIDRAVNICDAYYGDGSSVVELFEKADKSVVLARPTVLLGKQPVQVDFASVACRAISREGVSVYCVTLRGGIFFEVNLDAGKVISVIELAIDMDANPDNLIFDIQEFNGKLITIPHNDKYFRIYDIKSRKWLHYPKAKLAGDENIGSNTFYSLRSGEKLYCVYRAYPLVLVYDGNKDKWRKIKIDNTVQYENIGRAGIGGGEMLLYHDNDDVIYVFSTIDESFRSVKLPPELVGQSTPRVVKSGWIIFNNSNGIIGFMGRDGEVWLLEHSLMMDVTHTPNVWEEDGIITVYDAFERYVGWIDTVALEYRETQTGHKLEIGRFVIDGYGNELVLVELDKYGGTNYRRMVFMNKKTLQEKIVLIDDSEKVSRMAKERTQLYLAKPRTVYENSVYNLPEMLGC